jgi:hypothetical protein
MKKRIQCLAVILGAKQNIAIYTPHTNSPLLLEAFNIMIIAATILRNFMRYCYLVIYHVLLIVGLALGIHITILRRKL